MKSGIYMIMNLSNNKVYIGSSKHLKQREREHFSELRRQEHHNTHLQDSYNKYGREMFVFSIIEKCAEEVLIKREIYWILLKDSMSNLKGYNLSLPKEGGGCTLVHTQNKRVFGFNKITGELEATYNCIADICDSRDIFNIIDNPKRTYKGLVLVREENYDSTKTYTKVNKGREPYVPKGAFKGNPVETFNLETSSTLTQYNNKHELAEALECTPKQLSKVLSGERKSYKGVGVRYTV